MFHSLTINSQITEEQKGCLSRKFGSFQLTLVRNLFHLQYKGIKNKSFKEIYLLFKFK